MRRETDALRSVQRFIAGVLPPPWDVRLRVEPGREPERPYALVEQVGPMTSDGSKNVQEVTLAYTVSIYLPLPDDKKRQTAEDAAMDIRERVWQAVKWGADLHRPTPDRIPLFSYEPRTAQHRVRIRGATSGTWRVGLDEDTWTAGLPATADLAAVQAAIDDLDEGLLAVQRATGIFDIFFAGDLNGTDPDELLLDTDSLVGATAPGVQIILHGAEPPWRSPSDFMRVESFGQTTLADEDNPALVMVAVDLRCTFARGLPLPFDLMLLERISATTGSGG